MIELNKKTQQDFLNREWVQRLLEAGVDISDAKYCIYRSNGTDYIDYCFPYDTIKDSQIKSISIVPTYTLSELLYKLHEYIYPTIDGKNYAGGLRLSKDAPFYMAYYDLHEQGKDDHLTEEFYAEFEYPIESLASLLIQCHKKDIGIARKDTGNISDK